MMRDAEGLLYWIILPDDEDFRQRVDSLCWNLRPGDHITLRYTLPDQQLYNMTIEIGVLDRQENLLTIIEKRASFYYQPMLYKIAPTSLCDYCLARKERIDDGTRYVLREIQIRNKCWDKVMRLVEELDLISLAARLAMISKPYSQSSL